ncbi:ribbon-helix-helix domain-containing protein [Pelagibacterium sp. 26DY04]|uniref:ribbon-helix-helix domain-containing protein n=1 Tax=Pelagibacterium sp. 26DY04 TaxID=2967130 RepID=UPI002814FFBB|nr:ribbon-helix-helix domain-containing protein [Pelagibacterium sp. 26DY04]WMT85248.1 ribbon-helix-helix domain-containing protein [Pelagibacterium sp. 26DY04]
MPTSEIADLLDGAAIDALAEPEFRVLSLKGERKGIRLEAIFWQALDQIAANLGVPRNTLVLWIISAAGHDRSNATSVLRSVIVAYLLDEFEHQKPRRRPLSAPVPAMTDPR